jgi:hypothetical protein
LVSRHKPELLILVETHVAFSSVEPFWNHANYVKIDVQDVQGNSGGIWVMQRRRCHYSFTLVSKMHQCVSVIVSKGNDRWLCSGVYASPVYTARPTVWEYLADLSDNNSLPWLVIGDFNDILLPREQKGGVFSMSKADIFA